MAPEVIQENGHDFKADIWSLGITAIELVKGEPPNAELHPMKALFHIPKNAAPRLEGRYSRDFKSFVASCLVKDADERPTAKDLLQHRFIQRAGRATMLRELIDANDQKRASSPEKKDVRLYEETLRDMDRPTDEDDWVFDTIKPAALISPTVQAHYQPEAHTLKKRKLSQTSTPSTDPPTELMERLDLNNSHSPSQVELTPLPQNTIRTLQRRHSAAATGTARRITNTSRRQTMLMPPTPSSGSPSPSASPFPSPVRRQSNQNTGTQKRQPLAVDTSFGNSPSSARPFRRVSEERYTPQPTVSVLESSPPRRDNVENIPPPAEANTKEAKLGRKIFARVVDPAFQATYAHTASSTSREALANVGLAWSKLDALDPEGGAAFFRAIAERLQGEAKLSAAVLPTRAPQTPSRLSSTASSAATPTPTRTPARASATPGRSPAKELGSPTKPSGRLMLAQSNPHLLSHARRQSGPVNVMAAAERSSPALPMPKSPAISRSPSKLSQSPAVPRDQAVRSPAISRSPSKVTSAAAERNPSRLSNAALERSPSKVKRDSNPDVGMSNVGSGQQSEQSRRLSDALYARWVEGMRQRWPQQGQV